MPSPSASTSAGPGAEAGPASLDSGTAGKRGRILVVALGLLVLAGGVAAWLVCRQPGQEPENARRVPTPADVKKPVERPVDRPVDPRLKAVQPAVAKGVAFLREALKKKESWALEGRIGLQTRDGIAGLIGLTLLECGVPPDDADILGVADGLRKGAPAMDRTYVISAALFFFNRWDESRPLGASDRKLARSLGLRLCAGQTELGLWYYGCPILSAKQEAECLAGLEKGTPPPPYGASYSISNTQFAMLALWGARKHGIPVRETLLRTAAHFHRSQFPDGHWIYNAEITPDKLWTTATAAGLMALAMEKALREDREFTRLGKEVKGPAKRANVDKAFDYVARSIGRKKGDPGGASHGYVGTIFQADAWGDLYYLWTVERLGMIYGMDRIGGKDWYEWGYPIVLKHQKEDGSWQDRHQAEVDTCFALLFLRRANLAHDLSDKLRKLQ
jgi:hypothetical protein